MFIGDQRKFTILSGCVTILQDSNELKDIFFAIQTILKVETLSGEEYLSNILDQI